MSKLHHDYFASWIYLKWLNFWLNYLHLLVEFLILIENNNPRVQIAQYISDKKESKISSIKRHSKII